VGTFSAASTGAIAYRPPSAAGLFELAWVDRAGRTLATVGPPLSRTNEVEIAPDGRHAATVRLENDRFDLLAGRIGARCFDAPHLRCGNCALADVVSGFAPGDLRLERICT